MSFKNREEFLAAKRKSLAFEHCTEKKPQAAQGIDENEEDALFEAGEFGDSNSIALRSTVWWFLSLHVGFQARDESNEDDLLNNLLLTKPYGRMPKGAAVRTERSEVRKKTT